MRLEIKKIKEVENSRLGYGDLSDLMHSIKTKGLINPVTVSKSGTNYRLIAGHRRFNACKKLGLKHVECTLVDIKSEEDALIYNLTENIQRKDTSPFEEGRYYHVLNTKHDMGINEIAARVGSSKSRVATAIEIFNDVPDKFKDKIVYVTPQNQFEKRSGTIPASSAKRVLSLAKGAHLDKKSIDNVFKLMAKDEINDGDLVMYSLLLRDNPEMKFTDYIKNKDKVEIIRLNVPVLKDELDFCRKEYNLTKAEITKGVLYGDIEPFERPVDIR